MYAECASLISLEHLRLEGIRGAGLNWVSIKRALLPSSEALPHLFLINDYIGDGRLFAGVDKMRLSELPFLRACTGLEVLYLPAFYEPTMLAQCWSNLKVSIAGEYSEKSKSFVKQALRQNAINISYILDQDKCEKCYYSQSSEVQLACKWVPSRIGTLCLTCKDCEGEGRTPGSDAIFKFAPSQPISCLLLTAVDNASYVAAPGNREVITLPRLSRGIRVT